MGTTIWGKSRGEKGTGETVSQVIEHVEAHYEVQAMEVGTLSGKPLTEEEAYRPTRREYEAWMKEAGSQGRHLERLYAGGLFSGLAAKDEMNRVLDVLYGS